MGIKVVKPTQATKDEKEREPADEAQMMRAVEAWVKEFRSTKDSARAAAMRAISSERFDSIGERG